MKKIIAKGISLIALTTFLANVHADTTAVEHRYNNDQCDINLNGELRFANKTLTIKTKNKDNVKITANYNVFLNDEVLDLSSQETQRVKAYYDSIERTIPQVMTVAAEGVKIANYAVTEVLKSVLGNESNVASQLETKLNDLHTQLKNHVYQNPNSLTYDTEALETGLGFSADFDAEIDQIVSGVMEKAMGEFLVQMGRSILNGETSMGSFEERMEKMGTDIETKVEGEAKQLAVEAKKLCDMLITIDASEGKIQKIKGLSAVDIVTQNNDG
jgi:hypothetical protein